MVWGMLFAVKETIQISTFPDLKDAHKLPQGDANNKNGQRLQFQQ